MKNSLSGNRTLGRGAATVLAMLALVLTLSSMNAAAAGPGDKGSRPASPALIQYFQDIPTGNFFYQFTAALYNSGVVSGYTCGVAPAGPCVPPDNLPYYVPNNNVTRGLMSIYIDNARTKPGLYMTTLTSTMPAITGATVYTSGIGLDGLSTASGTANDLASETQAVYGLASGNFSAGVFGNGGGTSNSIGVRGLSLSAAGGYFTSTTGLGGYFASDSNDGLHSYSNGGYAGYFNSSTNDGADFGGANWGIYVRNSGSNPAVDAASSGTSSAGGTFESDSYRSVNVLAPPAANGYVQLGVTGTGPTLYAARIFNGGLYVEGDMVVAGSKTGYVVDVMQNADSVALEAGDVVVVADNSTAPVLGDIPVAAIKLANKANDTGVVGIVDAPLYVPDAATAAAYKAQQAADLKASQAADADKTHKLSPLADIKNRITDEQGTPHRDSTVTTIAPGKYGNVVTLGAYKAVKVDASFGAIHAGDLLTTSSHAGYAMKADPDKAKMGSIIGKALSGLDSGTGTVTVMVSLK